MNEHSTAIENRARTWLREAVRSHDTVTVSALRSLLGAIGNAEAVPVPSEAGPPASSDHVAGAAVGVGATEAQRRRLGQDDVEALVLAEIRERRAAMEAYGSSERSHRLAAEVVVLEGLLPHRPGHDV